MFHPLLLALVALTLTAFALPACTGAFFLPDGERRITPAHAGLAYRDVNFTTADGVDLRGWFLPARTGGLERLQQDDLDAVDLALLAGRQMVEARLHRGTWPRF